MRTDVLFYISLVAYKGIALIPVCIHPPTAEGEEPQLKGYVWQSDGTAIEAILPYSERHYERVDRLVQSAYFVEFTLRAMGMILPPADAAADADGDPPAPAAEEDDADAAEDDDDAEAAAAAAAELAAAKKARASKGRRGSAASGGEGKKRRRSA